MTFIKINHNNKQKIPYTILDFWYFTIGVNVIPIRFKTKKASSTWEEWQNNSIPLEEYERQKKRRIV